MVAKKSSRKNVGKSAAKTSNKKPGKSLSNVTDKVAEASVAKKPQRPQIDFEGLNRWNSVASGLLLLEAVAVLVAAAGRSFPVTLNFLGLDTLATSAKGSAVLAPATHQLFGLSLNWLVAVFLLAGAATYFLLATVWREFYEMKLVSAQANPIRWIGTGVSSGLMLVGISVVAGVQDIALLLTLFALALGMNGLYALAELQRQKAAGMSMRSYWIGTVAALLAWLVLALYAWGAHIYGAGVRPYLHVVYPVIFILMALSSVALWLQLKAKHRWADVMYSDKSFLILNVVTQSLLAWLLFAGSLRP